LPDDIEGIDHRVHILGNSVFAHTISGSGVDYRYSADSRIEPASLTEDIESRCIQLAQGLGLDFAGIDLRKSPDGEWYCFEVNPSPGFTYFDRSGNICRALARHLCGHAEQKSP
jgi:glutathione synthase/RimK-type ligase-like ATP-grasp enzyme